MIEGSKVHILFFEGGTGKGGSAFSLSGILRAMDTAAFRVTLAHKEGSSVADRLSGVELDLIAIPDHMSRPSVFNEKLSNLPLAGITLRRLENYTRLLFGGVRQVLLFRKVIKKRGVALVYLNNRLYPFSLILAARLARIPVLSHLRGIHWWDEKHPKLAGFLHKHLYSKLLTGVVAISDAVKDHYLALGFTPKKLHRIYNGVDISLFSPREPDPVLSAELEITAKHTVVGIISTIKERKGHDVLIKALAKVLPAHPDTLLLIVGSAVTGDLLFEERIKGLIEELDIVGAVRFLPWTEDVPAALSVIDILVQPSTLPEGLGRTAIEGMLAGKPLIVSDAGGLPELVEDGETGFVVPAGAVAPLASALESLLEESGLARRMGKSGVRRGREHFDIDKSTSAVWDIIESFLVINA